jgi:ferredoxin-NADP reductase
VERTKSVVSFRFKPQREIDFIPGQFVQILFDEKDRANKFLNKYLSFSCRPGKATIEVTKRLSSSDFSKRLLALIKDQSVLLKGPMGKCTLGPLDQKYAFLIGGIGITPVISMLEHIAAQKANPDIVFLYANMNDDDIPFLKELDAWTQTQTKMRLVHIVVNRTTGNERFFTGLIDKDFVLKQIPDYQERMMYIFGPPGMVKAVENICKDIGCAPEKVKAENFVGY